MDEPENEWELSKENVQPLRSGRKMSSLTSALQPQMESVNKLKEERQTFEMDIRTYSGNDPLEVWDRYIKWTEQNFPTGGKDSNLGALLERCVIQFQKEEKCKDDPRYVHAWLKFIPMCSEPLEIYNFMYNQCIGKHLATLYDAWAWELEKLGNFKKADAIYNTGMQNFAQPIDLLRKHHSEFQSRVTRRQLDGELALSTPEPEPTESQRQALAALKASKKGHVASNRQFKSGSSILKSSENKKAASNTANGNFQIFTDAESSKAGASVSALSANPTNSAFPSRSQVNRENEITPGVWTKARVKQKNAPVVPVTEISKHTAPKFSVHEDEDIQQPHQTPQRIIPQVSSVLSSHKPEKVRDPFQSVQSAYLPTQGQAGEENFLPMYCKSKIYGGAKEISFEELRAARFLAKKKKVPTATLR